MRFGLLRTWITPWEDVPASQWKYAGVQLTEDMDPVTKEAILEERAERKRVTSRAWHQNFAKKGATNLVHQFFDFIC